MPGIYYRNDESVQYVLPLMRILQIMKKPPTTQEELRQILEPMSDVVNERLECLMSIIHECADVTDSESIM